MQIFAETTHGYMAWERETLQILLIHTSRWRAAWWWIYISHGERKWKHLHFIKTRERRNFVCIIALSSSLLIIAMVKTSVKPFFRKYYLSTINNVNICTNDLLFNYIHENFFRQQKKEVDEEQFWKFKWVKSFSDKGWWWIFNHFKNILSGFYFKFSVFI